MPQWSHNAVSFDYMFNICSTSSFKPSHVDVTWSLMSSMNQYFCASDSLFFLLLCSSLFLFLFHESHFHETHRGLYFGVVVRESVIEGRKLGASQQSADAIKASLPDSGQ